MCDIFFSTQLKNNSNKKKICPTHGFNPTHVSWVGLGWTYVMGWVELNFFLTHHMVGWARLKGFFDPTHHQLLF